MWVKSAFTASKSAFFTWTSMLCALEFPVVLNLWSFVTKDLSSPVAVAAKSLNFDSMFVMSTEKSTKRFLEAS